MIFVDLHVHSKYSRHPSEWFLQKIGTRESYTEVEDLYLMAKQRGMRYVTITDHNTIQGALELNRMYPDDTFVSVEVTTYFPEDGCKIHVLVFDITEEQFTVIDLLRENIYQLREYIKEQDIAHSVAHATYSINRRLTIETLERLMVLFDVFEGINGTRNPFYNKIWRETLRSLTPDVMDRLVKKYGIEPYSATPWIKGLTGGSDDHAGLFIGHTYTGTETCTKKEFLKALKRKETHSFGRTNSYKGLAFILYKIVYDFSKNNTQGDMAGIFGIANKILFEDKELDLKNWFAMKRLQRSKRIQDKIFSKFFNGIIANSAGKEGINYDTLIDQMYLNIANLSDDFFVMIMESVTKDLAKGDAWKVLKNAAAALPAVFLSLPFFTTLKHLNLDKDMICELHERFVGIHQKQEKKILWFSDTFLDLNGVSVTLQKIARHANVLGLPIHFMISVDEDMASTSDHITNLPPIYAYTPDFYGNYTFHVPSLLKSMERICAYNPTEIIISTPGPVGLLGLLSAKLLGIKATGVYHTDFTKQTHLIIKDDTMARLVENGCKYFYSRMDEVRVPTKEYCSLLEERGFATSKMKVFQRGIDVKDFNVSESDKKQCIAQYGIEQGFTLMWSGRISEDKNVLFLAEIYKAVMQKYQDINLLIVGDGPAMDTLRMQLSGYRRVIFTGRVAVSQMPALYAVADLFVFPSTVDTFGMSVLEAQACGMPCLVTDVGGPQEIIKNEETGFVLPADDIFGWIDKIFYYRWMLHASPEHYGTVREQARQHIAANYSWDEALRDIVGDVVCKKETASADTSLCGIE